MLVAMITVIQLGLHVARSLGQTYRFDRNNPNGLCDVRIMTNARSAEMISGILPMANQHRGIRQASSLAANEVWRTITIAGIIDRTAPLA